MDGDARTETPPLSRFLGAALLSLLFPGLGQVLLGRARRGALVVAAVVTVVALLSVTGALVTFPGYLAFVLLEFVTPIALLFDALLLSLHPTAIPGRRWLACLALAAVLFPSGVLALRSRHSWIGFGASRMPSASMSPTLEIGDAFVWDARAYRAGRQPSRGDVVVFDFPFEKGVQYIKRVVAFGGETVSIRNGRLLVDGVPRPEPYLTVPAERRSAPDFGPVVVPADSFFVLGDNRARSSDSRSWGAVARAKVIGRPTVIVYSPDLHRIGRKIR